jgi:hypothetical protein
MFEGYEGSPEWCGPLWRGGSVADKRSGCAREAGGHGDGGGGCGLAGGDAGDRDGGGDGVGDGPDGGVDGNIGWGRAALRNNDVEGVLLRVVCDRVIEGSGGGRDVVGDGAAVLHGRAAAGESQASESGKGEGAKPGYSPAHDASNRWLRWRQNFYLN